MNSAKVVARGRIVRIVVERLDHGEECELRLDLAMTAGSRPTTRIRFHGVQGLRFRGATTELTELVVLMAEEMSEEQWEKVVYRVADAEEEVISFLCARIAYL